jgi:hypothetical protein
MYHDTVLYSILNLKCPRCHSGDMFLDKNPYHLKMVYAMPENCPVCGQSYLPEIGFWWGSMYISYGISVGLSLVTVLFLWLVMDWSDWAILGTNFALMIAILPLAFRYARGVWFNMFVRFDPKYAHTQTH